MKKKFRIIAAALALCLSVLCSPAALAGGYGSNPACRSSADHLDKPENRTAGLDTDPRREEVP